MRLRTFLFRRSIHTIITLVIVLVLLFIIFRLMPGDPTRFFIRPNQSEADIDALRVSLGFAKEVPAPGHGYRANFDTSSVGVYEIELIVNDSRGRSQPFYHAFVRDPDSAGGTEPYLRVFATAGKEPWDVNPQNFVSITATLVNGDASSSYGANITITQSGVGDAPIQAPVGGDPPTATTTWQVPGVGAYSIRVDFDEEGSSAAWTGFAGVAANPLDASPFQLEDDDRAPPRPRRIYAEPIPPFNSRTWININVTSSGASVSRVTGFVRGPSGQGEGPLSLFHPPVVVKNNLLEEFWVYFTNMLKGDFGRSLYSRRPVWDEISVRVGPSLLLFGSAVIISYTLGILVGAVLAWRRGSKLELSSIVISLFFYSMPVFWFGLILLWLFAYTIRVGTPSKGLFPLGGYGGVDEQGMPLGGLAYAADVLHHMALPLLNLVILSMAGHILLMRNSMLEVMGEDYITTARAKGISERRVMYRHAARNAMLPVVTAFALAISGTVSGGVLTETIFSWPGMGQFLVTQTIAQDFPSVQGAFFLLALLTILANLVADILYAYLDPRVRL